MALLFRLVNDSEIDFGATGGLGWHYAYYVYVARLWGWGWP